MKGAGGEAFTITRRSALPPMDFWWRSGTAIAPGDAWASWGLRPPQIVAASDPRTIVHPQKKIHRSGRVEDWHLHPQS